MSDKKAIYLLAGGRSRSNQATDPLIEAVYKESGKASPTIAYIGAANSDDEGFFKRMAKVFIESGAYRVSHALTSAEKVDLEKTRDIIKSADIVFISGGDVDRGMRVLRKNNLLGFLAELFQQGKPFFGSSAGAIMLAKEWVRWPDPDDNSSAEIFPCMGFAPVICDCHDEEYGWEELRTLLMLEEDNTRGYGIVAGAAIKVFPDGVVEAIGSPVHQYTRQGKKVNRTHDILPVVDIH